MSQLTDQPIGICTGIRATADLLAIACTANANLIITREEWLMRACWLLGKRLFRRAGYDVPENIRVSCSWPHKGGMAPKRRVLGQAWDAMCSADSHFEIFVSPNIDDPVKVLEILAHEEVHIVVGVKHGHRGPFRKCVLAIGLTGPMRSTTGSEAFKRSVVPILAELGPYPHGAVGLPLKMPDLNKDGDPAHTGEKPQTGRLRKAVCLECELTLRITAKWINGAMLGCPNVKCAGHDYQMHIE